MSNILPQSPPNIHNLTIDDIKQELLHLTDIENSTGFLYFLHNYVYVSHPSGKPVRMRDQMYQWQKNASVDFLKHKNIISLKQRQVGFSTLVSAYALWRGLFFEGQYIAIVSLSQRDSTEVLRRIKFSFDHLPAWLHQETSEFAKTSIEFKNNSSKIQSLPNTENPARGLSASLIILDEFAGFKNANSVIAAAIPALSAGATLGFTNQTLPSQLFIVSTLPHNPIENEYLRMLHGAQENEKSEFYLIEVDTSDIPQYQDPQWHRSMKEALGDRIYQIEVMAQEVYEVENSFLGPAVLERLKATNPIRVDFLFPQDVNEEGYMKDFDKMLILRDNFDPTYNYIKGFWIWEDPVEGAEYILIVDVASGRANDFSVIEVFNLTTGTQVAEYKGKCDLEAYKHIIELIIHYYNKAKLSIECTGLGQGVVDYFSETMQYENLYWHQKSKHVVNPGLPMSTVVRANALAMLASIMSRDDIILHSIRAINELRGFGYNKIGRLEALSGHDDCVMALAQYAYLINIGWAVSTTTITDHLIFGQVLSEVKDASDSPKVQIKTLKYFEDNFDIQVDDDTKEFLQMMENSGYALPLEHLMKGSGNE